MNNTQNPSYLVIRVMPDIEDEIDQYFSDVIKAATSKGAKLLGLERSSNLVIYEKGSIPFSTLIIKWPEGQSTSIDFWKSQLHKNIFNELSIVFKNQIIAFTAEGLPDKGLIDDPIPTIASYDFNTSEVNSNKFILIIDGTVTKPKVIDKYREILFDIMQEQKSYYIVLTASEGIKILHGKWNEDIFAISLWQSKESVNDFWYGKKYQKTAIPLRIGAGEFTVIGFS
jgi:uncharacterized protein (DUF1330 family)